MAQPVVNKGFPALVRHSPGLGVRKTAVRSSDEVEYPLRNLQYCKATRVRIPEVVNTVSLTCLRAIGS